MIIIEINTHVGVLFSTVERVASIILMFVLFETGDVLWPMEFRSSEQLSGSALKEHVVDSETRCLSLL